jgi:predicted PurR-regulated permease PerM
MSATATLTFLTRGIAIIVVLLLVAALHLGQDVLIPIVLAGLFCFVLSPIVNWLERWRLPRIPAAVLTCALGFAVVGALAYVVAGQLLDLAYQLPSYKENMRQKIAALQVPQEGPLGNLTRTFTELRDEALKGGGKTPAPATDAIVGAEREAPPAVPVEVVNSGNGFADLAQQFAAPVLGPIGTAAVVVVFVLFMLLKKEDLRNRVIHLAGRSRLSLTTRTLEEAGTRVSRYLLMQLVVNVTYGIPIGVGLWFIGVPNALLWGVLTAIVRFLPYIGPWIGAFFPLALSLAVSNSWTMPLLVVALFVVVELLSNNVVEPWLYGSSTGLSPVAILVAAVFWTWLWGAVGLVLATPLTVCLAVLGKHVPALAFLDVVLGDRPALPASDRYYQRLLAHDEDEATKVLAEYEKATSHDRALADLLAPAVLSGEADHESGAVDDAGYTFLLATVRKHAQREPLATAPVADASVSPDVLIIPAEDEGDEVVGVILGELLGAKVRTRVLAHQTLTNEKAAAAVESGAPVICISDTSRADAPRARFLGRLLRKRDTTAFVFTGLWSLDDEESNLTALAERFSADQAGTNLLAARDALRGWVVQPSVLSPTGPTSQTSQTSPSPPSMIPAPGPRAASGAAEAKTT